jgi:histidine phosphotransferase ChpT
MEEPSLDIASLIASRLCHDLISPIGAICNGLEVLRDEEDAEMRKHALGLIEASAFQAAARLEFARMAFGVASAMGEEVEFGEAKRLTEGLLTKGKTSLDWKLPARAVPKERLKLLLNLIHVALECIPRGGVLSVAEEASTLRLEARGPKAKLSPDIRVALFDSRLLEGSDSRQIQPFFTQILARAQGAVVLASESEDCVFLGLRFAS